MELELELEREQEREQERELEQELEQERELEQEQELEREREQITHERTRNMLVLSRQKHESIRLGNDVTITVLAVHGNECRIGIEAPADTRIIRSELLAAIERSKPEEEA